MKKIAEDIIILHICTKNHNHTMYSSWNFVWDRHKKRRYHHFTQVHHKWQSYDVYFLRNGTQQTDLFAILEQPKKSKFWKNETKPGDIIILHKCNKNHEYDHNMPHCSWDTMRDRCIFYLTVWATFCPFTLLATQNNQNFTKLKKKHVEISSFYTCIPTIITTWCTIPEI